MQILVSSGFEATGVDEIIQDETGPSEREPEDCCHVRDWQRRGGRESAGWGPEGHSERVVSPISVSRMGQVRSDPGSPLNSAAWCAGELSKSSFMGM